MPLLNGIEAKINEMQLSFKLISEERKGLLKGLVKYISNNLQEGKGINLIFICTHNSRRSIMSQIWAQTAADYFHVPNIYCYSGGTEATAFNNRAVESIKRVGFRVEKRDESDNSIYLVYYSDDKKQLKCFSKVYNDPFNPQKNFAAIMTCSDADVNCPVVFGAEARFPIHYEDPKEYDDTKLEEAKYDERFEKIGIEMLFVFHKINSK